LKPLNRDKISEQQDSLKKLLMENGASIVGFGDVSCLDGSITKGFPVAISLGLKYEERIVENLLQDEESFHRHMNALNDRIEEIIRLAEGCLSDWGYPFKTIRLPSPIKDNQGLRELRIFPHKTAATRSGLGWIGKNALLITPKYGPRIRLGTILTKAAFQAAKPIERSGCGACSLCAEACIYGAIHNVTWKPGIEREKLVDIYLCNQKRMNFVPKLGRKHSCGYCIRACKFGKSAQNDQA
jgi:epoxyqueuosine reductase